MVFFVAWFLFTAAACVRFLMIGDVPAAIYAGFLAASVPLGLAVL